MHTLEVPQFEFDLRAALPGNFANRLTLRSIVEGQEIRYLAMREAQILRALEEPDAFDECSGVPSAWPPCAALGSKMGQIV